jgi:hypothetical protein
MAVSAAPTKLGKVAQGARTHRATLSSYASDQFPPSPSPILSREEPRAGPKFPWNWLIL